jgi:translation elongation factor EF-G
MNAKPTIPSPSCAVEVQFLEEFQGAVMRQLNRAATIISSEKQEGFCAGYGRGAKPR